MVSGRDRGQLILIGAISLAFIILTLVVLFNGVLYTETVSSGETRAGVAEASVAQAEIEDGLGGLIERAIEDEEPIGGNTTEDVKANLTGPGDPIGASIVDYAGTYEEAVEAGHPAVVTIEESVDDFELDGDTVRFTVPYRYETHGVVIPGDLEFEIDGVTTG